MNTFSDLPLLPKIQKCLDELGFTKPTEIQAKVIPSLLEDARIDVHAQAQTGTGKTLAFGIPLLQAVDVSLKAVQVLVVAPTRELVSQTYESLKDVSRGTGIIIEPVYGGMSMMRQVQGLRRGAHVVVGTPGRLNDHLRRKTLSLKHARTLVLDEADIMLDMGFREEIDVVFKYMPEDRQIWLFSATVKAGIKKLIKSHMRNVLEVKSEGKAVVCSQVKQYFCLIPPRKRIEAAARFIEAAPNFYGIIFCQTKVLTSEVMERLVSKGFRANCLHGDMTQALRNQVIKGFKNKDFNILVATDVAARGIDVSDLTHVINFSIPRENENYIHRIGRTGRAGKEGIAVALVSPSEMHQKRRLERAIKVTLQEIPIPSVDAIINVKMSAVSDFIEQVKQPTKKLTPVHTAIKELIGSFSEQEIRNSLAIALEDVFFKDMVHEDLKAVKPDMANLPQEICVMLGSDIGFTEKAFRNYLHNVCKLLPQEVRKVRVLNRKTFISVPENRLQACIGTMKSNPIIDTQHKVFLVEDDFRQARSFGGRRSRGGSRQANDGFRGGNKRNKFSSANRRKSNDGEGRSRRSR